MSLYKHEPHPHAPVNVNRIHQMEQEMAGFNQRLAVWLTRHVGTMACAYVFAGIGIGGLVGAITSNTFLALVFGSISSYFLQLVLLPVILVGSNVLAHKQELQADAQFEDVVAILHHNEQIARHLDAQDTKILEILHRLEART